MILTCQKCSTSFRLDETLLKATGSKVRCSICQHMWVAFPSEAPSDDRPKDGDDGRNDKATVLGAAALGAGAVAAGLADDATDREPPGDTPPELKFFMDGEVDEAPSEEEDLVTDEINLDELDQLLSGEGEALSGPGPEEDFKTEELDLADLENMLAIEKDTSEPGKDDESEAAGDAVSGSLPLEDSGDDAYEKEDSVIEELDLDLEDLENLLEEDTGLSDEIASVEESSAGIETAEEDLGEAEAEAVVDEISLDMAPELDDLLEKDSGGPKVEETEELGDSDMADVLAASDQPTEEEDGDDQDFDFELAPGLDGIFDEDDDQEVPIEETEELDFSELGHDLAKAAGSSQPQEEDLELEFDEEAADTPLSDEGEDLADLELELDTEIDGGPSGARSDAEPELDLSALSQALGEDVEPVEDPGGQAVEPELELDFDLEGGEAAGGEELDLMLDDADLSDPSASSEASGDLPEETRELASDELEALLESGGQDSGQDVEGSSDSIELDIDLDDLDAGGQEMSDDATRELALDDIEKILEMGGEEGDAKVDLGGDDSPEDLDLELEMDSISPPPAEVEETGEDTTGTGDALDLSELEKMLDVEDSTDSPTAADEDLEDLDLDFDLQPATDDNDDLDLEFDMMDEAPAEASALFDTSESEDLGLDIEGAETGEVGDEIEDDLDFEIMDDDLAVEEIDLDVAAEEIGAETLSDAAVSRDSGRVADPSHNRDLTQELMDEMAAADTQTMAAPPMETKPIKPAPPPIKRKKKTSKSLVLLFILVLMGAAAYLLPRYTDIKLPALKMPDLSSIPYIGDFFGPSSPEAVVPVEPSLKGDWVQNQRAGRLYTIQGRVRNEYQKSRSFIRVTGRVYANGLQFQRAATAYCGNVLSAEQLATLPLADINKALGNRSGSDNRNVNVAPGQEVPFMVVFGDLPPDVELQEFAVEISGSLPVAGEQ